MKYVPYLLAGTLFGFTMVKTEAASWYRIMEMFYFQSFHMYGIMMSAIVTGIIGVQVMKRYYAGKASMEGTAMQIPSKGPGRYRFIFGGTLFGLGWGVIGLCPGPIFALVGMGSIGAIVALAGALHGTWLYGLVRNHLPE
ncbi:MAG: YeeE/YedE family protein [Thiobacillaceae bacterium]